MSSARFGERTKFLENTATYMPKTSNSDLGEISVQTYTRPSDWPTLPTISNHRFHGLLAIMNNDEDNYIAFRCQANGGFTVDWGDGVVENLATNTVANHKYTYSTLGSNVTSLGYKTAIVQVYPTNTSNTMTFFHMTGHPTINRSHVARWLDIAIEAPNLSNLNINGPWDFSSPTPMLEIANIGRNIVSNGDNLFDGAISLRSVSIFTNAFTAFRYTFSGCRNLEEVPVFNTFNVTDMSGLFSSCNRLKTVPLMNTSSVVITINMFSGCRNLVSLPNFDLSRVTTATGMFSSCSKIKEFPRFNFSNLTGPTSMFSSCREMRRAPMLNTAKVLSMAQMFINCTALEYVPCYDTSNVTDMGSMFSGCYSLKEIPKFNTDKVTNTRQMFNQCHSLKFVRLNMSNVTNAQGTFSECNSLTNIELISTSKVTDMSNIFFSCRSLKAIPEGFDVSNSNTLYYSFYRAESLVSIPLMNTSKVVNMQSAFSQMTSLKSIANIDTSNVTDISSMFNASDLLESVPNFNTAKVSNMRGTFGGCTNLSVFPNFNTSNTTNMDIFAAMGGTLGGKFQYLPNYNTYKVTTFNNFVNNANISEVPDYALHNVSTSISLNSGRVWRMKFKGVRVALNISNNFLSANALNEIYTNLAGLGNSSISNANGDGANITYTTSANHVYIQGQNISVTGFTSPTGYNVTNALILSRTDNTFTVAGATTGTPVGTGTANGGVVNTIITVSNNFGTASDNTAIATAKNWVVTG